MPQNFADDTVPVSYRIGSESICQKMSEILPKVPFDQEVLDFLNALSRRLLADTEAKSYADIVTFAFWIRKANTMHLKERFCDEKIRLGRGVLFHVAPANVPVNFAYSLVAALLAGNANIVRIPTKNFRQVEILLAATENTLEEFPDLRPYIVLVQYGHDSNVNAMFSALCDVRVIWGGDDTIAQIRQTALKPRATEVVFADRYSLAFIDADAYLSLTDKKKTAKDFYNDTYLFDQNACTSPRAVIWYGKKKKEAKKEFWSTLDALVREKYTLADVQAINKLTSAFVFAAQTEQTKIIHTDNYIYRISVDKLRAEMMEDKENSGYFFEYDCEDIEELTDICNDLRCQTISYIGDSSVFDRLLSCHIRGVDRIVPTGKTMDFDLIWDGFNLFEHFTRTVTVV